MNEIPNRGVVGDLAGKAKNKEGHANEGINVARELRLNYPLVLTQTSLAAGRTPAFFLGLPFDMVRHQYASAVRVGLIERSLLAWAKFDQAVSSLEKLILGPWARRV